MNQEQENLPIKKAKSKSKPKPKAKPKSEFPIDSQAKTPTQPKAKIQPKPQPKKESRTVMTESPITGVDYKTIEVDATEVSKMEAEVVQTEIDKPSTKEYWEVDAIDTYKKEPKEPNDKGRIILFVVAVAIVLLAYSYFSK
jgi:hypothetical protein